MCMNRLKKEFRELQKNPIECIRACPKEDNWLEWHYVIEGSYGSPYDGGHYHGIVTFTQEYPMKPPSIQMITPSGRFQPNTRLCLSMSDYHPETWTPNWGIGTILLGLNSFMTDSAATVGSIETSQEYKRIHALSSLENNCKNSDFVALFPDLVELRKQRVEEKQRKLEASIANGENGPVLVDINNSTTDNIKNGTNNNNKMAASRGSGMSPLALVAVIGAIIASLYVIFHSVS